MATAKATKGTPKSRATSKSAAELTDELESVLATPSAGAMENLLQADKVARAKVTAANINVAETAATLANVAFNIKKQLDAVADQVTVYVGQIDELRNVKDVAEAEVVELYGKEIMGASLLQLKEEYIAKQRDATAQMKLAEEQYAKRVAELDASYAAQVVNKRREWEQEQADYRFNTANQRRKENDDIAQQRMLEKRAHEETMAKQLAEIAKRSEELAAEEAAYLEAFKRVEGIPEEVKKEVSKAEAILRNSLTREFEHKSEIATMAAKAEKDMLVSSRNGLEQQLTAERVANAQLIKRLEIAEARVEAIAKEALQSASGRSALEAASSMAATLKDNAVKR